MCSNRIVKCKTNVVRKAGFYERDTTKNRHKTLKPGPRRKLIRYQDKLTSVNLMNQILYFRFPDLLI